MRDEIAEDVAGQADARCAVELDAGRSTEIVDSDERSRIRVGHTDQVEGLQRLGILQYAQVRSRRELDTRIEQLYSRCRRFYTFPPDLLLPVEVAAAQILFAEVRVVRDGELADASEHDVLADLACQSS